VKIEQKGQLCLCETERWRVARKKMTSLPSRALSPNQRLTLSISPTPKRFALSSFRTQQTMHTLKPSICSLTCFFCACACFFGFRRTHFVCFSGDQEALLRASRFEGCRGELVRQYALQVLGFFEVTYVITQLALVYCCIANCLKLLIKEFQ